MPEILMMTVLFLFLVLVLMVSATMISHAAGYSIAKSFTKRSFKRLEGCTYKTASPVPTVAICSSVRMDNMAEIMPIDFCHSPVDIRASARAGVSMDRRRSECG